MLECLFLLNTTAFVRSSETECVQRVCAGSTNELIALSVTCRTRNTTTGKGHNNRQGTQHAPAITITWHVSNYKEANSFKVTHLFNNLTLIEFISFVLTSMPGDSRLCCCVPCYVWHWVPFAPFADWVFCCCFFNGKQSHRCLEWKIGKTFSCVHTALSCY